MPPGFFYLDAEGEGEEGELEKQLQRAEPGPRGSLGSGSFSTRSTSDMPGTEPRSEPRVSLLPATGSSWPGFSLWTVLPRHCLSRGRSHASLKKAFRIALKFPSIL